MKQELTIASSRLYFKSFVSQSTSAASTLIFARWSVERCSSPTQWKTKVWVSDPTTAASPSTLDTPCSHSHYSCRRWLHRRSQSPRRSAAQPRWTYWWSWSTTSCFWELILRGPSCAVRTLWRVIGIERRFFVFLLFLSLYRVLDALFCVSFHQLFSTLNPTLLQ